MVCKAMEQRWRAGGHLFGLTLLILACGSPESRPVPLPGEVAGCQSVLEGPICVLPENGLLRLWLPVAGEAALEIRADRHSMEALSRVEVQLGSRLEIQVPRAAPFPDRLTVETQVDGRPARWDLALAPPENLDWREDAVTQLRAGEVQAARERVELQRSTEPGQESLALEALARFELMTGNSKEGQRQLIGAIAAHTSQGRLSARSTAVGVLVYHLVLGDHDFVGARKALQTMPKSTGGSVQVAYDRFYYAGILAASVGDRRTALRQMKKAVDVAERGGETDLQQAAEQVLADQLQELGRHQEAIALTRGALERSNGALHPCQKGQLLNNLGWVQVLAQNTGALDEDPRPALDAALELFDRECLRLPQERLNVRINLALAHLDADRLVAARRMLDELGDDLPEIRLDLWRLELEGRLALALGELDRASDLFEEMGSLASVGISPDAQWRASLGQAIAWAARGDEEAARQAFSEAEARLDEAIRLVPLTEGRDGFLRQRDAGARQHLALLLAAGHDIEAMGVALRSRVRVLRGLFREERLARLTPEEQGRWDRAASAYRARRQSFDLDQADDWRLPKNRRHRLEAEREQIRREMFEELDSAFVWETPRQNVGVLPRPPHGELVLLYHPLPDGWVAFALDAETLTVKKLECAPEEVHAEALGDCLFEPLAGPIARAEILRALPYGALRQVDFHTLTYNGDALLASKVVTYGMDLSQRSEAGDSSGPQQALLVSDPGSDLPSARLETDSVKQALLAADEPWEVQIAEGPAATGSTLRERIPDADLFHYAGHATFGGFEGWESALPMADGGRFEIGDILTLRKVPRWVVLSGCETGRTSRETTAETVSLAHAFLLTGSQSVVAATRPVADTTAREILSDFYRRWTHGRTAGEALRAAQLALRDRDPTADWSSFRIIEN